MSILRPSSALWKAARRVSVFFLFFPGEAARELRAFLENGGIRCAIFPDSAEALAAIRKALLPVLLLRWPLAAPQETTFLRRLRRMVSWVPVLAMGDPKQSMARIEALESGADFFLPLRNAEEELLAILASLGRPTEPSASTLGSVGLRLDWKRRSLQQGEKEVLLTPSEFAIMSHLLSHAGRFVLAEELAARLPSRRKGGAPSVRLLRVHLHNVREKLRRGAMGIRLRFVQGKGLVVE
ncbi:Transcriptional regulatory protein BasR [Methylacidimicrobium cyclopophantes]|uniref:Transcriptional regulatory protein BasR n=1 Tax=Methylacidimicrobium cyclopophantes TaxID=1041766 RepID=A0A5E6MM58_9BACT|nr:winged helix-turn-helix domain-containing protein [Methylacidimicrobium cyclopophantes]VVM07149.1 Transcriptional regulatory protein BasR [Methylacidimicrobium cyclopophantes]